MLCVGKFSPIHRPEASTRQSTEPEMFHLEESTIRFSTYVSSDTVEYVPWWAFQCISCFLSVQMQIVSCFVLRVSSCAHIFMWINLTYAMVNGYISCINRKFVNKFLYYISKRFQCIRCGINSSHFSSSASLLYFSFWLMDTVMITFNRMDSTCQRPM